MVWVERAVFRTLQIATWQPLVTWPHHWTDMRGRRRLMRWEVFQPQTEHMEAEWYTGDELVPGGGVKGSRWTWLLESYSSSPVYLSLQTWWDGNQELTWVNNREVTWSVMGLESVLPVRLETTSCFTFCLLLQFICNVTSAKILFCIYRFKVNVDFYQF